MRFLTGVRHRDLYSPVERAPRLPLKEGIIRRGVEKIKRIGTGLLVGTALFCSSISYAAPPEPKTNVVYEKRGHVTSVLGIKSILDVQEGKKKGS